MSPALKPIPPTVLIVGASRGLGYAMADEFLKREWTVIGTVRAGDRTRLHDLAENHGGRLEVETLDINDQNHIAALRDRLSGRTLEILFVNAGISPQEPFALVADVSTEEFTQVMMTNALSPMRVLEALQHLVPANGVIGAMSSGQGSITNNRNGRGEVYRSSKAALNMLIASFAARHAKTPRATVLMAPGWVRTDLGGPDAPFTIDETAPILVDLLLSKLGTRGMDYLDRFGKTVPW